MKSIFSMFAPPNNENFNPESKPYTPSELDYIIKKNCEQLENNGVITPCELPDCKNEPFRIFTQNLADDQEQKPEKCVAVFDTVADEAFEQMRAFDGVLEDCVKKLNMASMQLLIFPIAEVARRHFRMLAIDTVNHKATYHDSKGWFISGALSIACSLRASNGYPPEFVRHYTYVHETCNACFPGIQFLPVAHGHQNPWDHTNCGPLVAEYVSCALAGQKPAAEIDLPALRAAYAKILSPSEKAARSPGHGSR